MRKIYITFGLIFLMAVVAFPGCRRRGRGREGVSEGDYYDTGRGFRASSAEVERRLTSSFMDLDSAANLGELFDAISEGLDVEIIIDTKRISPETPIDLKRSRESLVVQILEYVGAATGTRYEIRNGKIRIKDAE